MLCSQFFQFFTDVFVTVRHCSSLFVTLPNSSELFFFFLNFNAILHLLKKSTLWGFQMSTRNHMYFSCSKFYRCLPIACRWLNWQNVWYNYIEFRLKAKTCRVYVRNKVYVDQMLFFTNRAGYCWAGIGTGGNYPGGNCHRRENARRDKSPGKTPAGKTPAGKSPATIYY